MLSLELPVDNADDLQEVIPSICTYLPLSLQACHDFGDGEHLNTCFKHFLYFVDEFGLIDEKEMAPLKELIGQFRIRKQSP